MEMLLISVHEICSKFYSTNTINRQNPINMMKYSTEENKRMDKLLINYYDSKSVSLNVTYIYIIFFFVYLIHCQNNTIITI